MSMKEAGRYLQRVREQTTSYSQADVAEAVGLKDPQAVSDWENGKYVPRADRGAKFIKLIGADPGVFHLLLIDAAQTEEEALKQIAARYVVPPTRLGAAVDQMVKPYVLDDEHYEKIMNGIRSLLQFLPKRKVAKERG